MNAQTKLNRRSFLQRGAAAVAAPLFAQALGAAPAMAGDSLDFATALQAAEAIRNKTVSSLELTRRMYDRIERLNPGINAVVTLTRDAAIKRAKAADEALAKGESWGAFHGVPITIKDTFEMKDVRTTAGAAFMANYQGKRDAVVVERMRGAGAVILGKTNVPLMAGDLQSYNDVFGQTNNPWNVDVTSGGSTGGGAAALAAGLTYVSIGSDIGGSIRTPANFCGVFGHKPTLDLVPQDGHIPPPPGTPSVPTNLAVAGPLARSADDLMSLLRVLGGPSGVSAKAYRWELPPARHESLKDFRVGYVIDDPFCPVVPETKALLQRCLDDLDRSGAQLVEGWPKGIRPEKLYDDYLFTLMRVIDLMAPPALLERTRELAASGNRYAQVRKRANEATANQAFMAHGAQLAVRALWQSYFDSTDVFLMPTTFTPAFPHDHSEQATRVLKTTLGERSYLDALAWISPATYTGCPATAMPAGLTPQGLPVGLQIMGPYLEDATPIAFAGLLSQRVGGYQSPPGFET